MNSNIGRVKRFIMFYSYDNQELMRKVRMFNLFKGYFKDAAKSGQDYCHIRYHSQTSLNRGVLGFS